MASAKAFAPKSRYFHWLQTREVAVLHFSGKFLFYNPFSLSLLILPSQREDGNDALPDVLICPKSQSYEQGLQLPKASNIRRNIGKNGLSCRLLQLT